MATCLMTGNVAQAQQGGGVPPSVPTTRPAQPVPPPGQAPSAPTSSGPSIEFKHRADDFIAAFDAADVEKLLALFASDSEYVDETGNLWLGKEEIRLLLTTFFENYPQAKLTIDVDSVRMLGNGKVVVEEGNRTIAVPGEQAWTASFQYIVVYTLVDNQWVIASIREFADTTDITPHDQLQPLKWLVGQWVNEGEDATVKIDFDWSQDGNYLIGNYLVTKGGETVRSSTHRIGWNPALGQIHSWIFDADGGFGEGKWAYTEDGWLIKSTSVLPDGSNASATLKWTLETPDRFKIVGSNRVVGAETVEDFDVVISRKPNVSTETK